MNVNTGVPIDDPFTARAGRGNRAEEPGFSAEVSADVELELLAAGDRVGIRDQFRVRQADADSPEREEGEGLDVLGRFAGVLLA
jgi:hypothetical protein